MRKRLKKFSETPQKYEFRGRIKKLIDLTLMVVKILNAS